MIYYKPAEHELEAASNSYLMSLLAVMAGLPFPIINLLATAVFYLANRHRTYFVRWHSRHWYLSFLYSVLIVCCFGGRSVCFLEMWNLLLFISLTCLPLYFLML